MDPLSAVRILTFHGVGTQPAHLDPGEQRVWLDGDRFAAVVEAVRALPNVRLTFDDGNVSDVDLALPCLAERGLRGEFFVCAGRLGAPGYLDARRLRELAEAGMSIGSHGWSHRSWRACSDDELRDELVRSREVLADAIGRPVTSAACPFGGYDRRVLRALRAAGYERVYTSDGGPARPGAWLQPRTTVLREHGPQEVAALVQTLPGVPRRALRRLKLVAKRWR